MYFTMGFGRQFYRNLDNKRMKKILNTENEEYNTCIAQIYFIEVQLCNLGLPNNINTKSSTPETPAMVKNPSLYDTWIHVFELLRFYGLVT